jgi:hypothetical protein
VYIEADAAIARLESGVAASRSVSQDAARERVVDAAPDDYGLSETELADIRGGVGAMRRELAPAFA